jgi:phosphate:Na+ symporter
LPGWLRTILESRENNESIEKKIFHREQVLDKIQREVVEFISNLMTGTIPQQITEEARQQLRLADEYESISDYVVSSLKILLRMKHNNLQLSTIAHEEIFNLHDSLADYLEFIYLAVGKRNKDILN